MTSASLSAGATSSTAAPLSSSTFAPAGWGLLPIFAGYREALSRLATCADWPSVDTYRSVLGASVDFVETGRLPAGLDASDIDDAYVGRAARGQVPTRPQNLHDLMGALVWSRFPRTKYALHARQVDVARARGHHTNRLRSRAQDRLAMLDEGGVFIVDGVQHIFGHALLEDAARGRQSRGFELAVTASDGDLDTRCADTVRRWALPTG